MSVFLRWGVFGILGVAALLYAYNANKAGADRRAARAQSEQHEPASQLAEDVASEPDPAAGQQPAASAAATRCEAELDVAERAIAARERGEPIDRLLRIPEIAWQEPPQQRARLAEVATRWYETGETPRPEVLRSRVFADCERVNPSP